MGDQMIGGIFGATNIAASKLNHALESEAAMAVDNAFQRIAVQSAAANGQTLQYDKNDYTRVAFTTKNDMMMFASEMGNQGVEVNALPFKVNGQWQVELKNNNTANIDGVSSSMTASALIDNYTQNTGNPVYSANNIEAESEEGFRNRMDNKGAAMAGQLTHYLESNLDALGTTMMKFGQIADFAQRYGNDSQVKSATVVNGNTVYIDGKIVTDKAIINDVLKQHNERMQNATKLSGMQNGLYVNKSKMNAPRHETKLQRERRLKAQRIASQMYGGRQEYRTNIVKKGARDGGKLDKMVDRLNSDAAFRGAVGKDLGLSFSKGNFTRADVLNLNKAFFDAARAKGLNVDFVKHGKFDTSALSLPAVQAAFSKETLDLMASVNTDGAWGGKNGVTLTDLMLSGAKKLDQDGDMNKMISTASKSVNYARQAATSVHNYSEAMSRAIDKHKANRANVKNSKKVTSGTPKNPKPKNQATPKNTAKKEQKYIKKTKKNAKKLARSEKGLTGLYNRAMRKVANSKLMQAANKAKTKLMKFLLKAAVYVLVAVLVICAILGLIVIIICIVEAIANFIGGLLKYLPSYFNKSAAFNLMENLKKREAKWIEGVEDWGEVEKWSKMSFGVSGQGIDDYANKIDGLTVSSDGKTLYIDPFYKVVGHYNASGNTGDARTTFSKSDKYNGELTVSYSANINTYGQFEERTAPNGSYLSTESGHTSNIKDIIAMTDVMFDMEMDAMEDGSDKYLNKSPAALNWDNFWDNWNNVWKTIGSNIFTFFHNLFSKNNAEFEDIEIGGVSYKTLQTYTEYLFQMTHRSQADLSISYYPVKDITLSVNEEMKTVDFSSQPNVASALGVCNSPVTHTFKIYYNQFNTDHTVSPYLEDETGRKYDLSTADFGATYADGTPWHIEVSDYAGGAKNISDLCLQDRIDFGSNYSTWLFIMNEKADGKAGIHQCWSKSDGESSVINYTVSVEVEGYDTEEEAKEAAIEALYEKLEKALNNKPSSTYTLSSDRNTFTANRYITVDPFEYDIEVTEVTIGDAPVASTSTSSTSTTSSSTTSSSTTSSSTTSSSTSSSSSTTSSSTTSSSSSSSSTSSTTTKTYTATATGVAYRLEKDKYVRDCQGHEFKYCGGHLSVNSQGIVHSMTNEQLALAAAYNTDEEVPTIKDFDFEGYGYGELLGKHIPEEIDRTTALSASETGGGMAAIMGPQGSVSGSMGLNLHIGSDGKLTSGYAIRANAASASIQLRDIFDADCLILKGDNAFPWGGEFELYDGWSADNMSLAISRVTVDWVGTYGMDANMELDRHPDDVSMSDYKHSISTISSTEDISNIIEALKANPDYADNFTEEQEEVIRLALSWVNRGHYNEYHNHAFLSELCGSGEVVKRYLLKDNGDIEEIDGISYDVNCTAGDDEDFVKFLLNRTGRWSNIDKSLSSASGWAGYSSTDDLRPADIIKHDTDGKYNGLELADTSGIDLNYVNDVIKAYADERYVFVIGKLGTDVELINGTVYHKDDFLTIDLQVYHNIGTVRIHSLNADSWDDLGFVNGTNYVTDEDGNSQSVKYAVMKNYFWVTKPDPYTKRLRLY